MIPLIDNVDMLEVAFKEQLCEGVDVVIDYLWGISAERLLIARSKAGNDSLPFRFMQVGALSGQNITLSSAVLRSSAIVLMGSGIGSVSIDRFVTAINELLQSTVQASFVIATRAVPLAQVETAWAKAGSDERTVFIIERDTL